MNIKEKISTLPIFWLLPFLSFLIGYLFAYYFFSSNKISVPSLIGLPIAQGVKKLSDHKLNIRIITEKEDLDLPSGTIISQKPSHNQLVKNQHAVFVVISKKPDFKKTPNLLGKTIEQSEKDLKKLGIHYKIYSLQIPQTPLNTIVAQDPAPEAVTKGHINLYQSIDANPLLIFPELTQKNLDVVLTFLERYNIKSTVTYQSQSNKKEYLVIEQRPLAGTLISLKNAPHVQLRVQVL